LTYTVGSRVRLLTRIGNYPAGTEAVVVAVQRDVCEVEVELGQRYVIASSAIAAADAERCGDSRTRNGSNVFGGSA
jgi:hypothetical protein